jgi:hypothetical protein
VPTDGPNLNRTFTALYYSPEQCRGGDEVRFPAEYLLITGDPVHDSPASVIQITRTSIIRHS